MTFRNLPLEQAQKKGGCLKGFMVLIILAAIVFLVIAGLAGL